MVAILEGTAFITGAGSGIYSLIIEESLIYQLTLYRFRTGCSDLLGSSWSEGHGLG